MASGRPVIAMTDPGSPLADLVQEARCGEVVPAGDHDRFVELLADVARDPGAWRARGRAARSFVVERYSRHSVALRYDALIRRVVSSRTGASA